jgi:hypothetical protein
MTMSARRRNDRTTAWLIVVLGILCAGVLAYQL